MERKYSRGNQMPFMTKELSKKTMTRSQLRSNFLKNGSEEKKYIAHKAKKL